MAGHPHAQAGHLPGNLNSETSELATSTAAFFRELPGVEAVHLAAAPEAPAGGPLELIVLLNPRISESRRDLLRSEWRAYDAAARQFSAEIYRRTLPEIVVHFSTAA